MPITLDELRRRRDLGIAALDQAAPGWRDHVDPDDLDMSSPWGCVLGQRFGSYLDGLEALGIEEDTGHRYAFEKDHDGDDGFGYHDLEFVWREVLVA